VSALSSLDAESRAACEARRLALESEWREPPSAPRISSAKEKAFLYSCLVAAVSAVDDTRIHARRTRQRQRKTLLTRQRSRPKDDPNPPGTDIDPLTH